MQNEDKDEATDSVEPSNAIEVAEANVEPELVDEGDIEVAEPAPRSSGMLRLLVLFALLVALASATLSGFLWWQYRQFYVELNDTDDANQAGLRQARTEIVALDDKLSDLGQDDRSLRTMIDTLRGDLERLPPRFVDFEERLQSVQGVSENSRRAWLRAEVQYLLSLANMELALAGRWETAQQALTLADSKLRELANPSLTPVREAIAGALQSLSAVTLADSEGINLALGNLASRVSEWPLKASADRSEFETGPVEIDEPPGLERAWASFKAALAGLVRIEKRDVPVRRALTLREESLLRLSLELELEAARLSLLRGDGAGFRASLAAAERTLGGDFDVADSGVQAALQALAGMNQITIDPDRPDISEPLILMRRLTETRSDANEGALVPQSASEALADETTADAAAGEQP